MADVVGFIGPAAPLLQLPVAYGANCGSRARLHMTERRRSFVRPLRGRMRPFEPQRFIAIPASIGRVPISIVLWPLAYSG